MFCMRVKLGSSPKERTQIYGVWEQGTEDFAPWSELVVD